MIAWLTAHMLCIVHQCSERSDRDKWRLFPFCRDYWYPQPSGIITRGGQRASTATSTFTFTFTVTHPLTAKGRWGTTDDLTTSFLHFFSVFRCLLGLGELQAYPFPDVVFPPLFLTALSSSPFHCALQDGFGQTWSTGDMSIPLQFVSLYYGQDVLLRSDCLLDLGTDVLVGNTATVINKLTDINYERTGS